MVEKADEDEETDGEHGIWQDHRVGFEDMSEEVDTLLAKHRRIIEPAQLKNRLGDIHPLAGFLHLPLGIVSVVPIVEAVMVGRLRALEFLHSCEDQHDPKADAEEKIRERLPGTAASSNGR